MEASDGLVPFFFVVLFSSSCKYDQGRENQTPVSAFGDESGQGKHGDEVDASNKDGDARVRKNNRNEA